MKQTPEKSMSKVIINYSAKTLLVLVILSLVGSLAYSFMRPKQVATFAYNRGWKVVAEHYYIKEYEKNENIDNLYNAVIISATNNSHKSVIKYYEKLENEKGYKNLIDSVNQSTEQLIVERHYNINVLSMLLNEDNYLKNKYISALIETDGLEKALNYAIEELHENQSSLTEQNNYLFANLITENTLKNINVRKALTEKLENENSVIEKLNQMYGGFYNVVLESNEKLSKGELTVVEVAYLIKAKQALKQIAHSLTEFNKYHETTETPHNQNIYSNTEIKNMQTLAIGS